MHNDPLIKLEDIEIPVVNEYKFLGVIFDRKLTFIPHKIFKKKQKTNPPEPNDFSEWSPTQNVKLTDKLSLNYTDPWSAQN